MTAVDANLTAEITAFLYREARLLDSGQLNEWLNLLADDVFYYSPANEWVLKSTESPRKTSEGFAFDLFNDDKASLKMRVERLLTGLAYSDLPRSLTQHLVSNVEVESTDSPQEVVARSKFLILQVRPGRHEGNESTFFGDRLDRLRRSADGWLICRREIHLAHDVLPRAVSILF